MIIEPKIRGFLCTTTHPVGCAQSVHQQIEYVKGQGPVAGGPKRALVIGCSAGYGLASRIAAAFGSGAATFGVAFERPAEKGRTASPGWYQSVAFDREAEKAGLYAKSIMGDAFSDEVKQQTFDAIAKDMGPIDLFIYSLASPRRTHPKDGVTYKSALRTISKPHTGKTLDFNTGVVSDYTLEPAGPDEVEHTIAVMGGEDWQFWVEGLLQRGLLAKGAVAVAYTYHGPRITQPIYRDGSIGKAKAHLEQTAHDLNKLLQPIGGTAYTSVNKALVTQASSAIPYMPLYISLLYQVMKEKNCHEGCIEQMDRLFREKLYNGKAVPVDESGRIRVDDWEMRPDIQAEVERRWQLATTETLPGLGDREGYRGDFLKLYGFNISGVDYSAEVPESLI